MWKLAKKLTILGAFIIPLILFQYVVCSKSDRSYSLVTHKSHSLILGMSRAKSGIDPLLFKQELGLTYMPQNIALTVFSTPYGKHYYEYVQKKLKPKGPQTVHIMCVSPGCMMNFDSEPENSPREAKSIIYNIHSVNQIVNLEYLLKINGYIYQIKNYLFMRNVTCHLNGWREYRPRKWEKPDNFDFSIEMKPNPEREEYFKKTIQFLMESGKVFLVRMPVSQQVQKYENGRSPNFNESVQLIADEFGIEYFDFSNALTDEDFYDNPGQHLNSTGAHRITKLMAEQIKKSISSDQHSH